MEYRFFARGHPNIQATHPQTIEFTREEHVTKQGNCIVGVSADFELAQVQRFLRSGKVRVVIKTHGLCQAITCVPNHEFCNETEMVIRKSDYKSGRTFGILADKSAAELDRGLVEQLRKDLKIEVTLAAE